MATWEIHLADRAPVRVVVPDDRNLAAEHTALVDALRHAPSPPPRWKFWVTPPVPPDPFWSITATDRLPIGLITGVLICKPIRVRTGHKPIRGFAAE